MNAQESDIMSVLQGKLRLLPSSPKERKQKLEYITRSIHICTTAEIEWYTDRCKHEHYRKIGTDHTSLYSQGKGEHDEMTFDLIS